jgi:acyl-[acyl-carrier-protein] desaturase
MPGAMIPGFTRKAAQIAQAGIYDLRIHHDEIVQPLLRHWGVFDLEGLDAEGEKARDELAEFVSGLSAQATRFEEQRARIQARRAARLG